MSANLAARSAADACGAASAQGVAEKLQRCLKTHEELVQGSQSQARRIYESTTIYDPSCRVPLEAEVVPEERASSSRGPNCALVPGIWPVVEAQVRNIRCDGLEAVLVHEHGRPF